MKATIILTCTLILASFSANSQGKLSNNDTIVLTMETSQFGYYLKDSVGSTFVPVKQASLNPNPGVYNLPGDNLICLIPDTKNAVPIPNAHKGLITNPFMGKAPYIPNPAFPLLSLLRKVPNK